MSEDETKKIEGVEEFVAPTNAPQAPVDADETLRSEGAEVFNVAENKYQYPMSQEFADKIEAADKEFMEKYLDHFLKAQANTNKVREESLSRARNCIARGEEEYVDEIVKGNNPRDVLAGKIAKYKKQIIE